MGRKSKERYAHLRKKKKEKEPFVDTNPTAGETVDGSFVNPFIEVFFRGQALPSHFNITVDENDELEEGQIIGTSRLGQVLYWVYNSVIARG